MQLYSLDSAALAADQRLEPRLAPVGTANVGELYDAHSQFVYRTLRSLGVPESNTDDALQDVFMVVHRRFAQFQGTHIRAWLFQIAINVAQKARHALWRSASKASPVDPDSLLGGDNPHDNAIHSQELSLALALLDELDEEKRAVFVMSEVEQMTRAEIAEVLGVHPNTVHYRLTMARQSFRRALQRHRQRGGGGPT